MEKNSTLKSNGHIEKRRRRRRFLLVLFRGFLLFGLLEPVDKGLSSLADLARSSDVDVLLASLGAPGNEDLLGSKVMLIVQLQDLGDLLQQFGVLLAEVADEALSATEQGFFMLVGRNKL